MPKSMLIMLSVSVLCFLPACSRNDAPASSPASADAMAPGADAVPIAPQGVAVALTPWTASAVEAAPSELCSLDAIDGNGSINGVFNAAVSQGITFEGWASAADMLDPGAVIIILDGATDFQISGSTGAARPDVAAAYGPGLVNAGFKIQLPELNVPPGEYALLIAGAGAANFVCNTKTTLTVG